MYDLNFNILSQHSLSTRYSTGSFAQCMVMDVPGASHLTLTLTVPVTTIDALQHFETG